MLFIRVDSPATVNRVPSFITPTALTHVRLFCPKIVSSRRL
jgi:hypothetical protein